MTDGSAPSGRAGRLAGRLAMEFLVIVLGVLVALWADSRVAEAERRATERARLEALRADLETTQRELRGEIDDARGAADALRSLIGRDPAEPEVVRERLLHGFFYGPSFSPTFGVYEDLKSSGELGLLSDRDLRADLSRMDARAEEVALAQADLTTVQQLNLDRYLIDRVDLRSLLGGFLGLDGPPATVDLDFTRERAFTNLALFKLDLVEHLGDRFVALDSAVARSLEAIGD